MKKRLLIIIILAVILVAILCFSVYGIQTVSTDKRTYIKYPGEEVKIHWSDFSLEWCTCSDKEVKIFKQETTGWERVQYKIYAFGGVCVNGTTILDLGMPCDVIDCSFSRPNVRSGNFSWNLKIYEYKGLVDSCLDTHKNATINSTMNSYELKNAPSGKYKIQFGIAYKIIEILPDTTPSPPLNCEDCCEKDSDCVAIGCSVLTENGTEIGCSLASDSPVVNVAYYGNVSRLINCVTCPITEWVKCIDNTCSLVRE